MECRNFARIARETHDTALSFQAGLHEKTSTHVHMIINRRTLEGKRSAGNMYVVVVYFKQVLDSITLPLLKIVPP